MDHYRVIEYVKYHLVCVCVLPIAFLQDYINQLPVVDHPEAFGQHSNADIASQIRETRYILYKLNWFLHIS